MSVQEIEEAIRQLPASDLADLIAWLEEFKADLWDKQIEEDARAGRLDVLAARADEEFEAGRCRPL
jgi:hypothetical protein